MDRCHLVSSLSFLHLLLRLILLQECDTSYHCLFIHLVYLDTSSDTLNQGKRELAPQMFPELVQASKNAAGITLIVRVKAQFARVDGKPQCREQSKNTLPVWLGQQSSKVGIGRVQGYANRHGLAMA